MLGRMSEDLGNVGENVGGDEECWGECRSNVVEVRGVGEH